MVKKALAEECRYGYVWSWWPVPSGYGTSTLDCIGCYHGRFFAVETKAPGEVPTPRQGRCIESMVHAEAVVFVVDGPTSLRALEQWLESVRPGDTGEEVAAP